MPYQTIRPLLVLSAAASILGLLSACSDSGAKVAQTSTPPPALAAPQDPAAPAFVQTNVTTDILGIDASRVVLERSQNWDVKQYAQKVIDARSKSGGELQQTLSQTGLPINPQTSLPPQEAATVAELRAAPVGKVDKLYLKAQAEAQEEALATLEKYADDGVNPALKAFAEKQAPEMRELQQATRALLNKLG